MVQLKNKHTLPSTDLRNNQKQAVFANRSERSAKTSSVAEMASSQEKPDIANNITAAAYIDTVVSIQANSLSKNSIDLHWDTVTGGQPYQIYSDMGTGYGVFIYKGQVTDPDFVDIHLRSGMKYAYRVDALGHGRSRRLGTASAATYVRAPLADAGSEPIVDTNTALNRPDVTIIPAPTPLPPDALLMGLVSDNSYIDELNTIHIVGQIRNDSNLDVGHMTVIVSFFDDTGNFIDEAQGPTLLDRLTPGQRSPFILSVPFPVGMADYSIKAVGRPVSPELPSQLSVVQSRAYEDNIGFYHVEGLIENLGTVPVNQAGVVVTLYSRGGEVLNVGFDPISFRLEPGARAEFDVRFTYFPQVVAREIVVISK